VKCPKCGAEMERKTKGDPFALIVGGNVLTIYQCPQCKNVEVVDSVEEMK